MISTGSISGVVDQTLFPLVELVETPTSVVQRSNAGGAAGPLTTLVLRESRWAGVALTVG